MPRSNYPASVMLKKRRSGADTGPWVCATFDGVDDYANCDGAHKATMKAGEPWKLVFGIKAASQLGARIITWGNSTNDQPIIYAGSSSSNGAKLRVWARNNTGSAFPIDWESTRDVLDGGEHTVEITWNGADTTSIVIDGTLEEDVATTPDPSMTINKFTLGALGRATYSGHFAGSLWGVYVYSDAGTTLSNLYPLNEGTGAVANDRQGTADGTIVNYQQIPFWETVTQTTYNYQG